MKFNELIYQLDFDKQNEEQILSFEYFFLNKNINNLNEFKIVLKNYSFINKDDLIILINLYEQLGIGLELENKFLYILNNLLYKKYLNTNKLKNLGNHIDKYNNILTTINTKIKKLELNNEENNDNNSFNYIENNINTL